MPITFGVQPVRSSFVLSSDADFYQLVRTSDGSSFPATAIVSIKWMSAADVVLATWTATVVTTTATFNKDKSLVAALLLLFPVEGRVFYEDGVTGPELLMARGQITDVSP